MCSLLPINCSVTTNPRASRSGSAVTPHRDPAGAVILGHAAEEIVAKGRLRLSQVPDHTLRRGCWITTARSAIISRRCCAVLAWSTLREQRRRCSRQIPCRRQCSAAGGG